MERQVGIIQLDLQRLDVIPGREGYVLHELQTDCLGLRRKRSGEHHHLLVNGAGHEDVLEVATHGDGLHDVITLIDDEVAQLVYLHPATADQVENTTGSTDDNGRVLGQGFLVLTNAASSEKHLGLDIGHELCEADVLLLDLEGKLAGVGDDEDLDILIVRVFLQHLKSGDDEYSGLTHTRLSLAQDILIRNSTGNARMLDYTIKRLHGLA